MLGEFILSSLTDSAIRKLQNSKDDWKYLRDGKICYDGRTILYILMIRVKPDNGHLIDDAKTKLTQLNVKNFNFSITNMLTEFLNLVDKIGNLGGTISTEDQAFYLWQCVKMMREQRFSYFYNNEHDQYCAAIGMAKPSLTNLIKKFKAKEINMKGENLWNKPTPEQAQILSLAAVIQGGSKSSNGPGKSKGGKNKSGSEDAEDLSSKKKEHGVKPWMLVAPKNNKPKLMMKNEKEYHWCPNCANGDGQLVHHKPANHSNNFKSKKKSSNNGSSKDESSKKKGKKNSSASGGGSSGDAAGSGNGGNSLHFNQAALLLVAAENNSDTRAFLSQFVPGNEYVGVLEKWLLN